MVEYFFESTFGGGKCDKEINVSHICVNADDFGISSSVSEAICECFFKGLISDTTIMVNMPGAKAATAMAEKYGFKDRVGLHLNLTAGVPFTHAIQKCPEFCDLSGNFNAAFHLSNKGRLILDARHREALSAEVEAQIREFIKLGYTRLHLDSHHHVHTDLSVWSVVAPALKKYGFRSVRISRNIYCANERPGVIKRVYKSIFNARIASADLSASDYFGSGPDYDASKDRLRAGASVEIMVHPVYSGDGTLCDSDRPFVLPGYLR